MKLTFGQKIAFFGLLLIGFTLFTLTNTAAWKTINKAYATSLPATPPIQYPFGYALKLVNENLNTNYVYATPATILSNSPFTLEGWFNITPPSSGDYLRDYSLVTYTKPQSPYDYGYLFRLSLEVYEKTGTGRPMFQALVANSYSTLNSNYITVGGTSSVSLQPNTWNHIAVTSYSENNLCYLKLFINGALADTASRYNVNCSISTQQPDKLLIAKPVDGMGGISGYFYHGLMDELRLSNTLRYTAAFTPSNLPFSADGNTLFLYHFNHDLLDASANNIPSTSSGSIEYVESTIAPAPSPTPTTVPPSPTPTVIPTATPTPASCFTSLQQTLGNLKYTFNNEWKHFVSFTSTVTGTVTKVSIKAGNWGNANRSVSCKITNATGTKNISKTLSSAPFTAGSQVQWREIDFRTNAFNLEKGQTYRLYCAGPDSWGSLYWIYNTPNSPNSKTYKINLKYSCQ